MFISLFLFCIVRQLIRIHQRREWGGALEEGNKGHIGCPNGRCTKPHRMQQGKTGEGMSKPGHCSTTLQEASLRGSIAQKHREVWWAESQATSKSTICPQIPTRETPVQEPHLLPQVQHVPLPDNRKRLLPRVSRQLECRMWLPDHTIVISLCFFLWFLKKSLNKQVFMRFQFLGYTRHNVHKWGHNKKCVLMKRNY